jgi:hypothetical protein
VAKLNDYAVYIGGRYVGYVFDVAIIDYTGNSVLHINRGA